MKIGIFTPIHKINEVELDFYLESISKLERKPDEVVILANGEAIEQIEKLREIIDKKVVSSFIRVYQSHNGGNIGALKRDACNMLLGLGVELLVELDYDDYLRADALTLLEQSANENPDAQFFYSNFAHFKFLSNGRVESLKYSKQWGWEHKPYKDEDVFPNAILNEMVSFPALPQFLARIESAPNHLRAFRSLPYKKLNYDSKLKVGDDHDLICRFFLEYGEKGFHHIKECLYYQRIGETTTALRNAEIQEQVHLNYLKYVEALYLKWSTDNDYYKLDLGGRFNSPPEYKSVDLRNAAIICDLNSTNWSLDNEYKLREDGSTRLTGIKSNSVGVLRAYHIVEHLNDPINFFNEAYRILVPGGLLLMEVPSLNHPMAFADPTHKSFWSTLNFLYFTNESKARFIRPQYKGAFLPIRVAEYAWTDGTLIVTAQLTALKGWYSNTWWGDKKTDETNIEWT